MKMIKLNYLLGILLLSLAFVCQSAEKDDLYSGKVPLDSQLTSARDAAIQQALLQVITKLTGSSKIASVPSETQANLWAQQFRYADGAIIVQFDQKAVDTYLKNNNVHVWSGDRPLTLVWMAVEENGTQAIVGEYELSRISWQLLFSNDVKARGVPVLFPLLDLTDQQHVELNDVWYHVGTALKSAAERYRAENTLSGRIYQNLQTKAWSADWLLALPSEDVAWQNEAPTPEELIKASVDRFANELAARATTDAPSSASAENIELTIEQVNNGQKYLHVMSYLSSLSEINTITPIKISTNSVVFRLKLKGSKAQLQELLSTSPVLQPSVDSDENILHYQYL